MTIIRIVLALAVLVWNGQGESVAPANVLSNPGRDVLAAPLSVAARPVGLATLRMFDEENGWALSDSGRVLRTTEGVGMWTDVTPPLSRSETRALDPDARNPFPAASFLDSDRAWVARGTRDGREFLPAWRTSDGGRNWSRCGVWPTDEGCEPIEGNSMQFLDANDGWALGCIYPGMNHCYSVLYRTTNGGSTWRPLNPYHCLENRYLNACSKALNIGRSFTMLTRRIGYAGGYDLQVTHNGGWSWSVCSPNGRLGRGGEDDDRMIYQPPVFVDSLVGGVVAIHGSMDRPAMVLDAPPRATFVCITTNGGRSWACAPAPARYGQLVLLDATTAWYIGKSDSSGVTANVVYRTTNGARSWDPMDPDCPLPLASQVQFLNAERGYAIKPYWSPYGFDQSLDNHETRVRDDSYLFETTDGGRSWGLRTARVRIGRR